jgi:hypothetical protein
LVNQVKILEQTILELQAPPTKLNIEVTSRPSPYESRLSTPDLNQDDSHFDGQIPANYSNVKKANLRIDQLIAEVGF